MTEERLKEIKDSIDFQNNIAMIRDYDRLFIDEELELYNEVIRLREIIDKIENYTLNHYIVGHIVQNGTIDDILKEIKRLKENKNENN